MTFDDSDAPATKRRRRWIAAAALAGTMLAGLSLWPIVSGKTDPPVFARKSAEAAFAAARRADAGRWAPESLMTAEAAQSSALTEYRIQEVKFLPFRDFTTARLALGLAEARSKRASDDALRARAAAKARADEAIAKADGDAGLSDAFGDAMHLAPFERKLLQKSKISLAEAKILYARGDYDASASRAREVSSSARRVASEAVEAVARFSDTGLVRNWRRQVEATIGESRSRGEMAIVVLKENRRLDLYDSGRLVKSYPADMGYRSFNDKLRSGDAATPEGRYRITRKRGPGSATYYRAFDLDYPNAEDRAQFERLRRAGRLPRGARLGGSIQIHGEGGRGRDWTRGCVAVSNGNMDDLFRRVPAGTTVLIVGGDGQGVYARLARQHATTMASGTR
jgi:lipoprotein-anchoring transpeptidase ErfK/SrfK